MRRTIGIPGPGLNNINQMWNHIECLICDWPYRRNNNFDGTTSTSTMSVWEPVKGGNSLKWPRFLIFFLIFVTLFLNHVIPSLLLIPLLIFCCVHTGQWIVFEYVYLFQITNWAIFHLLGRNHCSVTSLKISSKISLNYRKPKSGTLNLLLWSSLPNMMCNNFHIFATVTHKMYGYSGGRLCLL